MAYTYKVNNEKHYIYVQDANAVDTYPSSKFADDMNGIIDLCTPDMPIADFMTDALISNLSEYNKFLDLRTKLCDQVELMAKLKGNGDPVVYPDYHYFKDCYAKIYKYIADRNLSSTEARKYSLPFINEFKDSIQTVLDINKETARKKGYKIEKSTIERKK